MILFKVDNKFGLLVQCPPGSKPHPQARRAIATRPIDLHPDKGRLRFKLSGALSNRARSEPLPQAYAKRNQHHLGV